MSVRIATFNGYQAGLSTLQKRQADLVELQMQLTSGKRVARASDDPVAAARAERAMAIEKRTTADQRSLDASRSAMVQAESALGSAGELLQQVREQLLAAGDASYSDDQRASLAQAIRGLRDQLLALANQGDGAGNALFGGQGSTATPFLDAPGGVTFAGTPGVLMTAGAEPLPLTVDGSAIWLQIPDPDTGADTLSVFDVLDRVATELETPGLDNDGVIAAVQAGVQDVDAALNHLLAARSGLGELLNRQDSVELRLSMQGLQASAERSYAEDLDMIQALADFQNQQTGYDAALQAYATVQRLSLFDYVRG